MHTGLRLEFSRLDEHPAGRLRVGLSGGLDSCVLLHVLASDRRARSRGLSAVHVHHGLHADADDWAARCEAACAALDVPISIVRVRVERDSGEGLEAAARRARYGAFASGALPDDVLALAHHRDDQAETFLLRALRASGTDGLASMRSWRPDGAGWIWRPLLDRPRIELEDYAIAHGLSWLEDPGNADERLDRNFLRHRVMPLLRERWPHASQAFAESARLVSQSADLLHDTDRAALDSMRLQGTHDLDTTKLRDLHAAQRARLLRLWAMQCGLPPLRGVTLRTIDEELLGSRHDATPVLRWGGFVLRRWRNRLHASRQTAPWPAGIELRWAGESPLELPGGGQLALNPPRCFPHPLLVRGRCGGERIHLPGRLHHHALKNLLQSADIPPWEREQLPVLWSGDDVAAAGDTLLSAQLQEWLHHEGTTLHWRRAG